MAQPAIVERSEPVTFAPKSAPLRSRLPAPLRIAILFVLSLGINVSLWSAIAPFLDNELGAVSKRQDDLVSPFAMLAYKVALIGFGWSLDYDFIDIGALTLVANAPYMYLLATYYEVSIATVAAFVHIEIFSIAIPTFLLRPQSAIHDPNAPIRNRFLLNSFQVQTSTSLLAIGVYVVVIWSALKSGMLNTFLVTHFDVRTLEIAHAETPVSIAWKVFTAGIAAKTFLLNPSIGAVTGTLTPVGPFDPATATLPATLKHNVWFFSRRTRTLIRQTVVLSAFLLVNTVQRTMTLQGAELVGGIGYAGVWVLATAICAGWWTWVGDTESDIDASG